MRSLPQLIQYSNRQWYQPITQLFYSFFKTLIGQPVTVQLKNDVVISGILVSVDQFLNIKLDKVEVDQEKYPHMAQLRNCFVRGSVVRYVELGSTHVDTALLMDAARRELTNS